MRATEQLDFLGVDAPPDGLPDELVRGLELLATSPPLWPVGAIRWAVVVDVVRAFAERWDHRARACGWEAPELYSLHCSAPYARLDAMGAAFVLASSGHRAVAIDAGAIHVASATGSRLRIFRRRPEPDTVVLAWELCRPRA